MSRHSQLELIAKAGFFGVGLIHALPALGLFGRSTLERAYGLPMADPSLLVLMQHRALLFGLLSVCCPVAVLQVHWRWPVGVAAMASMGGFVAIAAGQAHNAFLQRVVWVDWAGMAVLALALLAQATRRG